MATIEIRDILDNETGKTIFPRTHVDAIIGLKDFSFFEERVDPNDTTKKYIQLKEEYTGLASLGWMAAGGIGRGGGGGGGGLISSVYGKIELGSVYSGVPTDEDLTKTFSAYAIDYIYKSGGASLSLGTTASYLKDSDGKYLLDSLGNRLVAGGSTTHTLNLVGRDGTVLSSVDLPSVSGQQVNADWNASSGVSQILNKPSSLPASDVSAWAKAANKPSYSLSEISGTDDLRAIEALVGTTGILKKTAANTWMLDTTTYLASGATLDDIADGTTRKLANYLPLAGGAVTGNLGIGGALSVGGDTALSGHLSMSSNKHIDLGPIRIEYDATNKALHITKKSNSDTNNYGIYADGFVSAGGVPQNA